ncbi:MAG TPA: metallophosphoesterase [Bdellovibrionales bacterium]|nr:metallophosphoesterase [Bdellovibrionales bacterium]
MKLITRFLPGLFVVSPLHALAASAIELPFCPPAFTCVAPRELSKFERVWIFSDIHGQYDRLAQLLVKGGVAAQKPDGDLEWAGTAKSELVIGIGDYINKGPKSIETIRNLAALQKSAAAKGSRVILTLGNHEAELLAGDGGKQSPELEESARRPANLKWLESGRAYGSKLGRKDLRRQSELAVFIRGLPIGAVVGTWLLGHSGFIDLAADPAKPQSHKKAVMGFFEVLGDRTLKARKVCESAKSEEDWKRCEAAFGDISGKRSFLAMHNWWRTELKPMRAHLSALGFTALFFGHDPEALVAKGDLAATQDGVFVKTDSGMSWEEKKGGARILKCLVSKISELGVRACSQLDADRGEVPLTMREL